MQTDSFGARDGRINRGERLITRKDSAIRNITGYDEIE